MVKINLAELENAYTQLNSFLSERSRYPTAPEKLKKQDLETFERFSIILSGLLEKFLALSKQKGILIELIEKLSPREGKRYSDMVKNLDKIVKDIKNHISRFVSS